MGVEVGRARTVVRVDMEDLRPVRCCGWDVWTCGFGGRVGNSYEEIVIECYVCSWEG